MKRIEVAKPHGCVSRIGTPNGTLVSGNMDQNLRNPSCLILSHTHIAPQQNWKKLQPQVLQTSCGPANGLTVLRIGRARKCCATAFKRQTVNFLCIFGS